MREAPAHKWALLITCEHASSQMPSPFRQKLNSKDYLALKTHRGWDPGALDLARYIAEKLNIPYFASQYSRLLVDCNRSPQHRSCLGASFRHLSKEQKSALFAQYYWPYRLRVEDELLRLLNQKQKVLHLALHSFTPSLHGEVRNADFSLLYDPSRRLEKMWAAKILSSLALEAPSLKLRRNYPYRGTADGFTTWLRQRNKPSVYAGLEIEVNQALIFEKKAFRMIRSKLVHAIQAAMTVNQSKSY